MTSTRPTSVTHPNTRLVVPLPDPFEAAVARYEQLVPAQDAAAVQSLVERRADWAEFVAQQETNAPYGFMIYAKLDFGPVMARAGDPLPCISYLMGNHIIAQRMFQYEPAVMLSAPLRTVICADADGLATFQVDQPSPRFASYDDPRIAAVGRELDEKLAVLIGALGAQLPDELAAALEA